MDKVRTDNMIKKRFKSIPENANITYFRNPRECCHFIYEFINPNHVGLIWGLQKKKIRKYKNKRYIQIAKVFFSLIPIFNFSLMQVLYTSIVYMTSFINVYIVVLNIIISCSFVLYLNYIAVKVQLKK